MSANLVIDLANTTDYRPSAFVSSGSNLAVGEIIDLLYADTYTNVFVAGGPASGQIECRIQTSDSTASGDFTDPTSGLAAFPVNVVSGGIFWANSGLWASGIGSISAPVNNAPLFCSGGIQFAAFQRPHRYARVLLNSGAFLTAIVAGFVGQKRTTASGAGFSYAPSSGTVSV